LGEQASDESIIKRKKNRGPTRADNVEGGGLYPDIKASLPTGRSLDDVGGES